ncbi:MAG: hypothetical protein IKM24_04945, partial [Clostridia bacterium]|nr:hypothetical protein [Clostridia bacterium]
MRTLFDFDYLRKDLSANANIRSEIERARSFVKLNNTVRAKSILEQLTDKHPESPCAWFARAEIASEDFNRVDLLEKVSTHEQYNKITKYLTNAIKMADANRKLLYSDLLNIYSLRCMESLADSFTAKLGYIVDSFEEVERVSIPKCPENCAMQRWISFSVSNLFDDLITNSQGTFYELPDDLISSVGARFPSVLLVNLHRKLMAEYIYPYSKAKREYNKDREAHNSCYEYSLVISKRYGNSYESSVKIAEEKANREHPLYADW